MKEVQKQLTSQEKATLIAGVDNSYSDTVKSLRKKMIAEGYLTSFTQVNVLDKLLWGVKETENSNLNKVLFDNLVKTKQVAFIQNIVTLFREGWMLSRAFKFYTGGAPVKDLNSWKLRRIIEVIEKKDKSDFDKFEGDKKVVQKPTNKSFKPKSKNTVVRTAPKVAGKDVPIIKK